jgi:hypothetical protein
MGSGLCSRHHADLWQQLHQLDGSGAWEELVSVVRDRITRHQSRN